MFICKLFPKPRKFLENHSVLTLVSKFSYFLFVHLDGAQGRRNHGRLWVSWVSPVATLHCSRAASSGSPENLTGSNACFRRASQVSCSSAKGEHHRFPANTHPISPGNYQGKIGHCTIHVWPFPNLCFPDHTLACQHFLQARDSAIQSGQLACSHTFWSAGKSTTPRVHSDHPEITFNELTSISAPRKLLLH